MSDAILFEQRDAVGIITINRPKANQLNHEVFEEFRKTLDIIELNKDLRAVIVTGAGDKIFSAGADLTAGFGDYSPVDFLKRGQDLCNKIEYYTKPVIAALNGHAFGGGCEIAISCHFRFIKKDARIGLTETNLGIMPGYGGTLRLQRYIGRAKALEYMLLGKQIDADEALALGLVNRICKDDKVMEESFEFAQKLVKRPPLAVKAILRVMAMSPSTSPDFHLQVEREELAKLFVSKDTREGLTAFMEKREPVFTGE